MYTPTIGIEVHAELKTKSKMFCGCANDPHAAEANARICPICMAEPGTLPVINKEAVHHVLKVGVALGSEIATFTEFDRKNYFYPDIPKGYQISQYKYPLVSGGKLAGIDITRVHLEEDTARSQHEGLAGTLVDYNRAGVPLMELVTEPVIHDIETAGKFVRELQLLLRTLGVSDANLEKGEMRVEANISISKTEKFGTKVEVKNLNSFRAMESAIAYELKRHEELLERGESVVQETRGWDENKGKTFSQRSKENADEYRYFPDPDLPKLDISKVPEFSKSRLEEIISETPDKKRLKYDNLGLTSKQVEVLIQDIALCKYFEEVLMHIDTHVAEHVRTAVNYLTTDALPLIVEAGTYPHVDTADNFAELITLVSEGTINSRVAKDLLKEVLFEGMSPKQIANERGLMQQSDADALLPIIAQIIAENHGVVAEFKSGKESVLQFLVGQGMKLSRGSANPGELAKLLKEQMLQ